MAKLTTDQQNFVDNFLIEKCFNDKNVAQVIIYLKGMLSQRESFFSFMDIIDSVAVIISVDATPAQKQASKIILKYAFGTRRANDMVEDVAVINDREDPLVRRWRNKVLNRDNYTCQHCGSTEKLAVHHISYWSNDPVNRINIDNGITLCQNCHAKEHWGEKVYSLIAKQR